MSNKLVRIFAAFALIAGALAVAPSTAQARYWHGRYWGGYGWGWGYPYAYPYPYYYRPYYYGGGCGYVRVRYWRHGHWHIGRRWRCW